MSNSCNASFLESTPDHRSKARAKALAAPSAMPKKAPANQAIPQSSSDSTNLAALDLGDPAVEWAGAFWHWAHYGEVNVIVQLLREGVPLSKEDAGILADILDGAIRRKGSAGGAKARAQEATARRNERIRLLFRIIKEDLRNQTKGRPGVRRDLNGDAIERCANAVSLSKSTIKRIVETRSNREFKSFEELTFRPPKT